VWAIIAIVGKVTPMTANAIAWTITATVWAGIIAPAGIWVHNRVFAWYHSHGRAPAQEPPHRTPATAALTRRLSLLLVRWPLRDRTPQHEGATESFGDELRALADLPPAPELVTDAETELRWAKIWHDFEHDLQVQVDEIFNPRRPLLMALTGPLDAKTCMRLDAAAQRTGEFERAELDALLAVTG
jgi:hypothetical protein